MIKRRIFYSYHYATDSWRAATVRNIGVVEGNRPATDNRWEEVKSGGDPAIRKWIADQLRYRSCTLVLVGTNTAGRRWIDHEIKKSWEDGMGLAGIHIHGLRDQDGHISRKGENPFAHFTVEDPDGERRHLSSVVKCYSPPGTNSRQRYKWIKDNLADIVEEALRIRRNYPVSKKNWVMARSGVYTHGPRSVFLTPETILDMAKSFPDGKAIPFIVEHDYRTMPFGKVVAVHAEESVDGVMFLFGDVEMGDVTHVRHGNSGRTLCHISFGDNIPFVRMHDGTDNEQCRVSVGLEHFDEQSDYDSFVQEVTAHKMSVSIAGRHSAVLEPLITFVMEQPIGSAIIAWILARIVKQANRLVDERLASAVDGCVERVSLALRRFNAHRKQDERALTIRIIFDGTMSVALILEEDDLTEALGVALESLRDEIDALANLLENAESVALVYRRDAGWQLYHMTTGDGTVIGSEECWERTNRRIKEVVDTRPGERLSKRKNGEA